MTVVLQDVVSKAPMLRKKDGQIGKYMTMTQMKKLTETSKTMRQHGKQELLEKKTRLLEVIDDVNHNIYSKIPVLIQFDFFDVYALRKSISKKNYLNSVARENIRRGRHTLQTLLPFLHVDIFTTFGDIAIEDWRHHRDVVQSMKFLMNLRRRGDHSTSVFDFLSSIVVSPDVEWKDFSRYLTKHYLKNNWNIKKIIQLFLSKKNMTRQERQQFLHQHVKDEKIRSLCMS
jgi:hypothetical protein